MTSMLSAASNDLAEASNTSACTKDFVFVTAKPLGSRTENGRADIDANVLRKAEKCEEFAVAATEIDDGINAVASGEKVEERCFECSEAIAAPLARVTAAAVSRLPIRR